MPNGGVYAAAQIKSTIGNWEIGNDFTSLESNVLLCSADFDEFYAGCRSGNGKTIFAKTFDVELNGFLNES